MKKNIFAGLSTVLFVFGIAGIAAAAPIDLNDWTQRGVASNGTWNVAADGSNVLQTTNGQPTYFVSNANYINTSFEGSFAVEGTYDDDFIGFVFGWNSTEDFYLFDWKQANQNAGGGYAPEGFTLSKISGTDVNFWNHTGTDITVLDTSYSTSSGWADNTSYDFLLDYTSTSLSISIDGAGIFSEVGVFATGQFGFYNFSQSNVRYQGFEDTPIPEPATIILFGAGLVGLAGSRLRKKRK